MSKKHLTNPRSKAYALLLLNTVLWGLSPPIIKVALNFVTVNQFLLGRYLIASLIFLPIYFLTHKKSPSITNNHYKLLIFLAILGTPLTLIPLYEGIKLTSSIEASILTAAGPIMLIIGGRLFLKEKIEKNEEIGLIIALLGTLLLALEPLLVNSSINAKFSLVGNALILFSTLIWTGFLLLVKKLKTDATQISLVSYLVSIPIFAILVLLEPTQITNIQYQISNAAPGIAYMAIFGSVIAFWAYTKGQEMIEAGEASIFTYLQPLVTLPLAYFWLHESLSGISLLACLLIGTGVYFSEYHR